MSNKFLTYITCSFRWSLEIGFIGLLVTLSGHRSSLDAHIYDHQANDIGCYECHGPWVHNAVNRDNG